MALTVFNAATRTKAALIQALPGLVVYLLNASEISCYKISNWVSFRRHAVILWDESCCSVPNIECQRSGLGQSFYSHCTTTASANIFSPFCHREIFIFAICHGNCQVAEAKRRNGRLPPTTLTTLPHLIRTAGLGHGSTWGQRGSNRGNPNNV